MLEKITQRQFFERINKMDKLLLNLTRKQRQIILIQDQESGYKNFF